MHPYVAEGHDSIHRHLPSAAGLDLTIDPYLTGLNQLSGTRTVVHDTGQLQQLTQPDGLVADGDVEVLRRHGCMIAADRGFDVSPVGRPTVECPAGDPGALGGVG